MSSEKKLPRRDFLRNAVMLAGAGVTAPLWAVMKYDRNAVLRYFREQASEMDARVKAGIEANRKGDVTLLFTDAQGRPCENVHVKVRQTRHDFKYGANLFGLSETKNGAEHAAAYRERFAAAFNLATLPFYWQANEPEPGKYRFAKDSPYVYRRPPIDMCLEFCEANGIEPKAHCLNYVETGLFPKWVKGDVKREKELVENRFRELAARYARRIPMWEVTNETLGRSKKKDELSSFFSAPDFIEWNYKTAAKYFTSNRFVINDNNPNVMVNHKGTGSAYYKLIKRCTIRSSCSDCLIRMPSSASLSRSRRLRFRHFRPIPETRLCRRRSCATSTASGSRTRRWRRLSTGISPMPTLGCHSGVERFVVVT